MFRITLTLPSCGGETLKVRTSSHGHSVYDSKQTWKRKTLNQDYTTELVRNYYRILSCGHCYEKLCWNTSNPLHYSQALMHYQKRPSRKREAGTVPYCYLNKNSNQRFPPRYFPTELKLKKVPLKASEKKFLITIHNFRAGYIFEKISMMLRKHRSLSSRNDWPILKLFLLETYTFALCPQLRRHSPHGYHDKRLHILSGLTVRGQHPHSSTILKL